MHIPAPEIEYLEARMVEEGERASIAEAASGCRYARLQVLGLVCKTNPSTRKTGWGLTDDDADA